MSVKRVLHVLPDLAVGGGQRVVLNLVIDADPARYRVSVAYLSGSTALRDQFTAAGAQPECLHAERGEAAAALRLAMSVRRQGVELLHVHSGPDRRVGHAAGLIAGIPVVSHLHSPWDHRGPMLARQAGLAAHCLSRIKASARDRLERRAVLAYIAAGDQVAAYHGPRSHLPLEVVANGVPVPPPRALDRTSLRRRLGLPTEEFLMVCVGRLEVGKGQDRLVELLPRLPGRLVLVGDGELRRCLSDRADELDGSERLIMLGQRRDVGDLLHAADVFVFASESEGLPLAVMEAMAHSLPVVVYDLPAFDDLVVHGVSGLVAEQGDASSFVGFVQELRRSPESRERLGVAARRTISERYSSARTADGVMRVYDGVLRKKGS